MSTSNSSFTYIYNSFKYTPSSRINSLPHVGNFETYSGGGYVFDMIGDASAISSNLSHLRDLNWIDAQTVAIFIEFTLFNPNLNLFQSCSILFEILQTGTFVNTAQFIPIDLYDINNSALISFKILINILFMIFVIIYMIVEIKKIIQKRFEYFLDVYNYIELIIIGFAWAAFSMYLYRLYGSYEIYKELTSSDLKNVFINLQYITSCDLLLNYFLAFCVAFATLRFIKIFRFNKRIIVFFVAFKQSLKELISFGFIYLILWLSFAQVFYLLLNDQTFQFSTFANSISTCFQIMLGKFNADAFRPTNSSFLRPVLFVCYNICFVFVVLNTMITILVKNYQIARESKELDCEDPDMYNYLKSLAEPIFCFFRTKKKSAVYTNYFETMPNRFDENLERLEKVFFRKK